MITFAKTKKYQRARDKYIKRNSQRAEALIKTLQTFSENPQHPALHLEKLGGSTFWTIRINRSDRIFFIWTDEEIALLVDVGEHDKYKHL